MNSIRQCQLRFLARLELALGFGHCRVQFSQPPSVSEDLCVLIQGQPACLISKPTFEIKTDVFKDFASITDLLCSPFHLFKESPFHHLSLTSTMERLPFRSFFEDALQRCPLKMPIKDAHQGCPLKMPIKDAHQGCPSRMPIKDAHQGCPSRMSTKDAHQGCPSKMHFKDTLTFQHRQ